MAAERMAPRLQTNKDFAEHVDRNILESRLSMLAYFDTLACSAESRWQTRVAAQTHNRTLLLAGNTCT